MLLSSCLWVVRDLEKYFVELILVNQTKFIKEYVDEVVDDLQKSFGDMMTTKDVHILNPGTYMLS